LTKIELFGLFADEIAAAISPYGLEKYRGRQIAEWLYQKFVRNFDDMTNLARKKREVLAENFMLGQVELQASQQAVNGQTDKFLLALGDGLAVETVLMRHNYGNSVCVSSQVGCGMGCIFCASTINGLIRNLTAGEMLAQVLFCGQRLGDAGRPNSIVIMGSGEPLANYDQVLRFIRLCHEDYCLNMSFRSFTLSTAGLVPGIDRLAEEGLPVTLAISLHAPNDALRSRIMPINDRYPLAAVLAAADRYANRTGRRVTYEYTLIAGMNDSDEQARELAAVMRGRLANVNLIPVNAVAECGVSRPDAGKMEQFLNVLRARQVNATIRREMGGDIKAACGQLRHSVLSGDDPGCN